MVMGHELKTGLKYCPHISGDDVVADGIMMAHVDSIIRILPIVPLVARGPDIFTAETGKYEKVIESKKKKKSITGARIYLTES